MAGLIAGRGSAAVVQRTDNEPNMSVAPGPEEVVEPNASSPLPGPRVEYVTPAATGRQPQPARPRRDPIAEGSERNFQRAVLDSFLRQLETLPPGGQYNQVRLSDREGRPQVVERHVAVALRDGVRADLRQRLAYHVEGPLDGIGAGLQHHSTMFRAFHFWDLGEIQRRRARYVAAAAALRAQLDGGHLVRANWELSQLVANVRALDRAFLDEAEDTALAAGTQWSLEVMRDFSVNAFGALATAITGNVAIGAGAQGLYGALLQQIQQSGEVAAGVRDRVDLDEIVRGAFASIAVAALTAPLGSAGDRVAQYVVRRLAEQGLRGPALTAAANQVIPVVVNTAVARGGGHLQVTIADRAPGTGVSTNEARQHLADQHNLQSIVTEVLSQTLSARTGSVPVR